MIYNQDQIKEFLPHRSPFLFVDSIESIKFAKDTSGSFNLADSIGGIVHGKFKVNEDLDILSGHFPGNPILPGVVQVEIMAQTACMMLKPLFPKDGSSKIEVALLTVSNAKFRKPVVPGMELDIKVEALKTRASMMTYHGVITCDDNLCSEAEFMASCGIKK